MLYPIIEAWFLANPLLFYGVGTLAILVWAYVMVDFFLDP